MISFKSAAFDLPTHLGQRQTQKFTDAQIGSEKKEKKSKHDICIAITFLFTFINPRVKFK